MISIPKVQWRLLSRKIHRRCSECKELFAIALAATLVWGCGWNDTWIIGDWVRSYSWAPYSDLLNFKADGKFFWYDNYDGSGLKKTGTWSLNGDILSVDGTSEVITKISDDYYVYKGLTYYRQFTEPGGDVFDQTAVELTDGDWKTGTIPLQKLRLYSFLASGTGIHEISWDDQFDGSGGFSSDLIVSAYESDKTTPILKIPPDPLPLIEEDDGYFDPFPVALTVGETVYIIVDAYYQGGSFRIMVRRN